MTSEREETERNPGVVTAEGPTLKARLNALIRHQSRWSGSVGQTTLGFFGKTARARAKDLSN